MLLGGLLVSLTQSVAWSSHPLFRDGIFIVLVQTEKLGLRSSLGLLDQCELDRQRLLEVTIPYTVGSRIGSVSYPIGNGFYNLYQV